MKKYICSKQLFLESHIVPAGVLEIEEGVITAILDVVPEDTEQVIDHSNFIIAPGFVDTHIHGMVGHDVMDATSEGIQAISEAAAKVGVTTFLPTTLTASDEDTSRAIANVAVNKDKVKGARIGGIFLEGPFFAEKYKGAQNPDYFLDPEFELLRKWKNIAGDLPIKIAIAPERRGALEFIEKATAMGVTVALGHSDATYDQAKAAVEKGAKIFVHMYNAMSPLHHRNPGMVGAGLTMPNVFAELICDGHHVHPAAAQVVIGMRKSNSTALVTDCMSAGSMPEGQYKLGEFDVTVKDGTARMEDGNLAGSILLLKDAIKNVVRWKLATPFEAVQMATITPAKSVGIDNVAGKIEVGRMADLVVLDDQLELQKVYLGGEEVC